MKGGGSEEEDHPLLINDSGEENIIITNNNNNNKISIFKHKYLNQLILLYLYLFFYFLSTFLYDLFIPSMISTIVKNKYPDLSNTDQKSKESYYKSYSDALPFIMFIFCPLLGKLSDKYGRKSLLYLGISSLVFDIIACYISIKTNNIIVFYIFHTIGGLNNLSTAAVFASITDISIDKHIELLYSLSGLSMGLSTVIGSLIYAFVPIPNSSSLIILYISIGISLFGLLISTIINETIYISRERNIGNSTTTTTTKSSNPLKNLKKLFTTNGYISWVVILYLILQYTGQDIWSTFFYYSSLLYSWKSKSTGFFVLLLGAVTILFCAVIGPTSLKYYSPRRIISIGFFISFCAHTILVLSGHSQYLFIVGGVFVSVNPLISNLISSVISKATPRETQGMVLSGLSSIKSLGSFLGSLAANDIFMYSLSNSHNIYFPQAIYLTNAIILLITTFGSIIIWRHYKTTTTTTL